MTELVTLTLPDELYDSGRGQYRVDRALTWLGTQTGKASFRTVGVLDMDAHFGSCALRPFQDAHFVIAEPHVAQRLKKLI